MVKNKHSIIIIILLLLFFTIEALYLFALPKIIKIASRTDFIVNLIKKETNLDVSVKNAAIKTRADFSLVLFIEQLDATSPQGQKVAQCNNLKIRIFTPSLFLRKLNFKNIDADYVELDFNRNKNGQFNIGGFILNKKESKIKPSFKNSQINIKQYDVGLEDEYINQTIDAKGDNFIIKKFTPGKHINLLVDGSIDSNGVKTDYSIRLNSKMPVLENINKTNFILSGHINNFEPKIYLKYIQRYIDKDILGLDGKITAAFNTDYLSQNEKDLVLEALVSDLYLKKEKKENCLIAKGKNAVNAKFNINKKVLNILSAEAVGDKYKISISGKINDFDKKNKQLDLTVKVPKSRIEAIYWLFPPQIKPPNDEITKVKKYGAYGDIEADFSLKGNNHKPYIGGYIEAQNVYILEPLASNVPKAVVKLKFNQNNFDLYTKIYIQKDQNVTVEGNVIFIDKKSGAFHIYSTESIDAKVAHKLLLPIQDVIGFTLGPVPMMSMEGSGNVDITTKGTKARGYVEGKLNFKNTKLGFNGINATTQNTWGSVIFSKDIITVRTDKANALGSDISIHGFTKLSGNGEGENDYKIEIKNVKTANLLNLLNTSPMLEPYRQQVYLIQKVEGQSDFNLKLAGKITDVKNPKAIEQLKVSGELLLNGVNIYTKDFFQPLKDVWGNVKFDEKSSTIDAKGKIIDSLLTIKVNAVNDFGDIKVDSEKLDIDDVIKFFSDSTFAQKININLKNMFRNNPNSTLKLAYKGKLSTPNWGEIIATLVLDKNAGTILLNKNNLKFENLKIDFFDTKAELNGSINNIFSKKPVSNLIFNLTDFNLANLNEIKKLKILPDNLQKIIDTCQNYTGQANVRVSIVKDDIQGKIELNDIGFRHAQFDFPVSLKEGLIILNNDKIEMKSLNIMVDNSPVFVNLTIGNAYKKPYFKGYVTAKLSENLIKNYINENLSYPIKINGELSFSSEIKGSAERQNIKSTIKFNEGSDVYYMGASLGDSGNLREIQSEINFTPNHFYIKNIDYMKYITSQNGNPYPMQMVNAKGNVTFDNNKNIFLDNFTVKTSNPISARFLNILFKKSLLKEGSFTGDLLIHGNLNSPTITGQLEFKNIDIPLYSTLIKDINLDMDKDLIRLKARGMFFTSDILINSTIENKIAQTINIKEFKIHSNKLYLDKILDDFSQINYTQRSNSAISSQQAKTTKLPFEFNPKTIVIEKAQVTADELIIRGLPAKKFIADFSEKADNIDIENVSFEIAGGKINGTADYNFTNSAFKTELFAQGVDSNTITTALFDLKNQISGNLNGRLNVETKGTDETKRLQNLTGVASFDVQNGRMPKLGSIEYLLRAGNTLKSGVTGLSVNSIISILTPINTGNFSSIKGNFVINKGIIDDLQIYSKGENLNIYIKGSYDIVESNANIRVLGRLSKKINNLLGPVGNASLNSLFGLLPGISESDIDNAKIVKDINKIPGVEISRDDYRIFTAKIEGDINSENSVKSFQWVEK